MNSSIPGLSTAIRSYTSEKLKERSQGLEQIRDIFDSRDNVSRFQETASKEGGAGWVAFFQCLFQVVVMEKKAVMKKAASAQGTSCISPKADGSGQETLRRNRSSTEGCRENTSAVIKETIHGALHPYGYSPRSRRSNLSTSCYRLYQSTQDYSLIPSPP
jgi:hypothetical protein